MPFHHGESSLGDTLPPQGAFDNRRNQFRRIDLERQAVGTIEREPALADHTDVVWNPLDLAVMQHEPFARVYASDSVGVDDFHLGRFGFMPT